MLKCDNICAYDSALSQALDDHADSNGADRAAQRSVIEQVHGIQVARKRMFASRKPSIICIISAVRVQQFIAAGVAGALPLSERNRRLCRQVAAAEIAHIADLMEAEPMGLQFGLLPSAEPTGTFEILRSRDRANIAISPFRADGSPASTNGVAMITAADEAIAAHQRVAEALWRDALKGTAGAARLRQLLAEAKDG